MVFQSIGPQVFEQSITIQATATRVERCFTDRDLMHRWLNPALRCDPVGDWTTELGGKTRFVLQVPLLEPALHSTVVERSPGLVVWEFTGFFSGRDRWECQPLEADPGPKGKAEDGDRPSDGPHDDPSDGPHQNPPQDEDDPNDGLNHDHFNHAPNTPPNNGLTSDTLHKSGSTGLNPSVTPVATRLLNRFEFTPSNPIVAFGFQTFAAQWTKRDMEAQLRRLKRVAEELQQLGQ
ncbi:MAG: SRPBCC family protein [Prochlorothrix sp.]|nr:SRPBCC family protein [Prochlorothrix sp.]